MKQKYDVTLESFGKPLRNPSEVYTWLNWYDDLWKDGVAVLTREELDSFLFHLDNAESQAAKAKQRSYDVVSQPSEGEAGEEDRYALLTQRCSECDGLTHIDRASGDRKEKFTLFSDHNGSLLRRQPGAMTIGHSPTGKGKS